MLSVHHSSANRLAQPMTTKMLVNWVHQTHLHAVTYVCLQAITFVPAEEDELVDMYKRWAIAYSRTLMCHLRETEDLAEVLKVRFTALR